MDAPSWQSPRSIPAGPPRRQRPEPAVTATPASLDGRPVPPAPANPPSPAGSPPPAAAPLIQTRPGWGWRALVAFVAGGLVTGAGFAVGQRATSDPAEVSAHSTTPVSTRPTTVPPAAATPPGSLAEQEPAQYVAQTLGPSVVKIRTDIGLGSGVIYREGLVLTNHHVITGASEISIQLSDGRHYGAEVAGSDPNADIAVITVLAPDGVDGTEGQVADLDLPVAPLALEEKAQVGQLAIAIGAPFSLQQTVTEGIVSAVDRPVPSGSYYTAMIQTDAPINPGNSGGALADRYGRVIGINTAIHTGANSNVNAGVGFAIPIDTAVSVADRLLAGEPIEPGFLGVSGQESTDGSAGVELTDITPESAAEVAGLRVGDRILSIDGAPVAQFDELAGLVVARQPGDQVVLEVVRDGEALSVQAVLGERPD